MLKVQQQIGIIKLGLKTDVLGLLFLIFELQSELGYWENTDSHKNQNYYTGFPNCRFPPLLPVHSQRFKTILLK